jgi:hypothetical protein
MTTTTLYINGVQVNTAEKAGKIAPSLSFCLGADIQQNNGTAEFFMTDFSLADVKIYDSSLNFKQVETAYNNAVSSFDN